MSKGKNRRTAKNLFYDAVCTFLRRFLALLLRAERLDWTLPDGPVILVLNHVSVLDPVIVGGHLRLTGRRARALAKSELFKNPVLRRILSVMGQVPVYRNSERAQDSLGAALITLQEGDPVAIYPEGTVPKDGAQLGPLKTGATRLALLSGAPIVCVAQKGAERVMPPGGVKFRRLLKAFVTRPRHTMILGVPFTLTGDPDDRTAVEAGTARLREEMLTLIRHL